MKISPLYEEMKNRGVSQLLIHTGQHYDENMSKVFFEDLSMPQPDIYYGIGSGSHAEQTARVMIEFEKTLMKYKPDLVVVVGDVNSTLACALVCAKQLVPVAHVEAGLRSFDRRMPEEINRIITDSVSDFLFTPSIDANENLISEGVDINKIHFVGNIMIDSLHRAIALSKESTILDSLRLEESSFGVMTLHRPSNVDDIHSLENLLETVCQASELSQIVFPIHPRTKKSLSSEIMDRISSFSNLVLCDPLGYLDFTNLLSNANFVMTDSGGIQEESTALGIPCLTLRENTERPITVSLGTNTVVGNDPDIILANIEEIIENGGKRGQIPEYWDGNTASRIAEIIQFAIS